MKHDYLVIKDDINFLEHPNWVVSKRDFSSHLIIKKETGFYELKSAEGLPLRFDKIVLYYLLHKLFTQSDFRRVDIVTTRYEIAKNVFPHKKNFSKANYDRLMLALKRWKAIIIKFEGTFLEECENFTVKYFSVIDLVSLDRKNNELVIHFNELYIKRLKNTKFYNLIDFQEYKKLTRPVSIRLYELLTKNFFFDKTWLVYIDQLGEQLTLGKRGYASQVLVALRPAIKQINEHCRLQIEFNYVKSTGICVFKRVS